MIELNPDKFSSVLPIIPTIKHSVLPAAICEGITPGRVFVDRLEKPQTGLIWSRLGYYFLAGSPTQVRDFSAIRNVLTDTFIPASVADGMAGIVLVTYSEAWNDYILGLLPERKVTEIYRRAFTFDPVQFYTQGDWRSHIPPGFRLQPVDAALAEGIGILEIWPSVNDFLTNGLGFALMDGEKIASVCTSAFASHERVEIDIYTDEVYRHRGFAKLTASALIEKCLCSGKRPNWECFCDNQLSAALASKLGFSHLQDYSWYYCELKYVKEINDEVKMHSRKYLDGGG
jgi:hypothetical protein